MLKQDRIVDGEHFSKAQLYGCWIFASQYLAAKREVKCVHLAPNVSFYFYSYFQRWMWLLNQGLGCHRINNLEGQACA